jgi:hypothetical protein
VSVLLWKRVEVAEFSPGMGVISKLVWKTVLTVLMKAVSLETGMNSL